MKFYVDSVIDNSINYAVTQDTFILNEHTLVIQGVKHKPVYGDTIVCGEHTFYVNEGYVSYKFDNEIEAIWNIKENEEPPQDGKKYIIHAPDGYYPYRLKIFEEHNGQVYQYDNQIKFVPLPDNFYLRSDDCCFTVVEEALVPVEEGSKKLWEESVKAHYVGIIDPEILVEEKISQKISQIEIPIPKDGEQGPPGRDGLDGLPGTKGDKGDPEKMVLMVFRELKAIKAILEKMDCPEKMVLMVLKVIKATKVTREIEGNLELKAIKGIKGTRVTKVIPGKM